MFRRMVTTVSLFQAMLNDIAILLLRVVFGGLMLVNHGWDKLMKYGEMADKFPDPIGLGSNLSLIGAISGEVIGSALLISGFCTRIGGLLLAFTMGVAAFVVHANDPLKAKEMAILYLAASLAVALLGGGRLSVDRLVWKKDS